MPPLSLANAVRLLLTATVTLQSVTSPQAQQGSVGIVINAPTTGGSVKPILPAPEATVRPILPPVGIGPISDVAKPLLGIHGAQLLRLCLAARDLGIDSLPLHPLGLLPESATDEVLSLPGRWHDLKDDSLSRWVLRHQLAEMRAFRYLVDHNLTGLAPFLQTYQTLPWRVEFLVDDRSTPAQFNAGVHFLKRRRTARDEAVIVTAFAEEDRLYVGSSLIKPSYSTVTRESYALIQRDLEGLQRGDEPLGLEAL